MLDLVMLVCAAAVGGALGWAVVWRAWGAAGEWWTWRRLHRRQAGAREVTVAWNRRMRRAGR